jgi:hypothetical protein
MTKAARASCCRGPLTRPPRDTFAIRALEADVNPCLNGFSDLSHQALSEPPFAMAVASENPSSSQPVIPPIIIFTGNPS